MSALDAQAPVRDVAGNTDLCGSASRCPLCRSSTIAVFQRVDNKCYWRCQACQLTFLDPSAHLAPDAEYQHYLSHENDVADPRYRSFLSRLASPLLDRLARPSVGLDYGCGPGPALAHMLREAGHQVDLFDPFFAPDQSVLDRTYDFVTCTETIEHFFRAGDEFDRFDQLLRPGGILGLMTCFQTDDDRFAAWHYRKDPTHVAFYRRETLAHVAGLKGWAFESPAKDVAIMRKPSREVVS